MQAQEGRRLEEDCCAEDSTLREEQGPEGAEDPVQRCEIRCAFAGTGEDQELVFEKEVLREDDLGTTRSEESSQRGQ